MAFKLIVVLAFVAVASAGLVPATQVYHAAQPVLTKDAESYDPHPQYQFSYSVNDAHTGDSKSQTETRDGDVVQGEYSLIDADGYKRTVQYSADSVHGFNAVVNREPLGQVVKTVAATPVAYAAPTVIKSAPLAYAAAPSLIRSSPLGYASYGSVPAYTQTYAAAPTLVRSSPISYSHGPAAYTAHNIVASAPLAYAAGPAYAAAPAYAYHH